MISTDRLRDFIVDELRWSGPRGELTDDYPLLENHVIDSLGIFQLVGYLETEYDITIDESELIPEKFATLASIAELVERAHYEQPAQSAR